MLQQPRVSSIHHGWGKGIPATRTGLWKHEPEARLTTMASNTHQCAIFGIDYIHCNVAEYSWLLTQWSSTHALVTFQFGQDWSFTVIVIDLPKYMNDVLHFSIQDNGLYTSLPQLLKLIVSLAAGALSDWLIGNNYMSITNARKIYISLCEYSTFCQYPSTREIYNSRLIFYFISFGSVGHLHCARILCRMRQIDGRRLFYHFDCVPRCARCVYQSIGFVSQLCRYFDGHRHHHRRYDRHFGTVCRWCSHTACKCYRCDIMLGLHIYYRCSVIVVITHRMALHFLDHIRTASGESGCVRVLGLGWSARLERAGRCGRSIAQGKIEIAIFGSTERP